MIAAGNSQEDVGTFLEHVTEAISERVDLTVDVTHGFRHFSFLTYIAVIYLTALHDVRIRGAYYGMLNKHPNPSPFLDLRPLLDLPRWVYALEVLRDTGSTLPMARILRDGRDSQPAHDNAGDLTALSEAYLSGLPLELGWQAWNIRKSRRRPLRKLLRDDHRLPLADKLVEELAEVLAPFALADPPAGAGWKREVGISTPELRRQVGIIDGLLEHGSLALPAGPRHLSGGHRPLAGNYEARRGILPARPGRVPGMAGVAQEVLSSLVPKGRRRGRMSLPLHKAAQEQPPRRGADGHAGLWFDKFCDQWRVDGYGWSMTSSSADGKNNPKLSWINTLMSGKIGRAEQIRQSALRLAALVESRGGRWEVLTTESRFVTGLGRSHPIENGFAWHPTLGTPYLPGSSIKGMVRAWTRLDADPKPDRQTIERLLGGSDRVGSLCLLDAVPIEPVQLEADVMTPHYAGWTENDPPGDWRSPVPIPFLVTAPETPFLFGLIPCRTVSPDDLDAVSDWLRSALSWAGGGAKTAVGYGRFGQDAGRTDDLRQRLRDRDRARDQRIRDAREADERARRLAALSPVEREIEEILHSRQDRNMPETTVIVQHVRNGRWAGAAKIEAAAWLQNRMQRERRWKEQSGARNPAKDRDYQRTLLIKRWLVGE